MKRRIIFFLVIMAAHIAPLPAKQYPHLAITTNEGTNGFYSLKYKPQIIFLDSNMIVVYKYFIITYPISQITKLSYEMADDNSGEINEVLDDNGFDYINNTLILKQLNKDTNIRIYTLNGQLVLNRTLSKTDEYILSLDMLPDGIYLVNVNSLTYKIEKK